MKKHREHKDRKDWRSKRIPLTILQSLRSLCSFAANIFRAVMVAMRKHFAVRLGLGQWTLPRRGLNSNPPVGRVALLSLAIVGVLSIAMLSGGAKASPDDLKSNSITSQILYGDSSRWTNLTPQALTNVVFNFDSNFLTFSCSIVTNSMFGEGWAEFNFSNEFNYYRRVPTNIVIKTNYPGTIQVGTNFLSIADFEHFADSKNSHWECFKEILETNAPEELQEFDLRMARAEGWLEGVEAARRQTGLIFTPTNSAVNYSMILCGENITVTNSSELAFGDNKFVYRARITPFEHEVLVRIGKRLTRERIGNTNGIAGDYRK